jgi:hypothetical protein
MEYEFVKVKQKFNLTLFRKKAIKWLISDPTHFLWNMGIYHVLIIIFTLGFGLAVPAKVMLQLGMGDVAAVQQEMTIIQNWKTTFNNVLFLLIILTLDLGLLIIIKSEFKHLNLSWSKIAILEVIIFALGIVNPYVRTGLFFFSANTLQIAIAYRWMIKKWIGFQYFFVVGSTILILKLIFYVLWVVILFPPTK